MFTGSANQSQQMPPLPDGPSLDNLRGPIEIPLYQTWHIVLIICAVLLVLAVLIWLIRILTMRRPKQMPPPMPGKQAIKELEAASELALEDDRFAAMISNSVKRYFEIGLPAPCVGKTTEEFLRSLKGNTRLDTSYHEALKEFLTRCDAIRYTRFSTLEDQREQLVQTGKELIQNAEQRMGAV